MDHDLREKKLDEWLDSALAEYGRAEPRSGIEARILEHVRSRLARKAWRLHWRHAIWASVGALAVLLFLIVISPKNERPYEPGLVKESDQELLLGIDGLLNREVPAALEPALVLTQEIAKSKKE